jgi:hypothetical protein
MAFSLCSHNDDDNTLYLPPLHLQITFHMINNLYFVYISHDQFPKSELEMLYWLFIQIKPIWIDHVKCYLAKRWTLPRMMYSCEVEIDTKLWFLQTLSNLISNCSRVCTRWTLWLTPHWHERKLFVTCVSKVTFNHIPQPVISHIQSFGTLWL